MLRMYEPEPPLSAVVATPMAAAMLSRQTGYVAAPE